MRRVLLPTLVVIVGAQGCSPGETPENSGFPTPSLGQSGLPAAAGSASSASSGGGPASAAPSGVSSFGRPTSVPSSNSAPSVASTVNPMVSASAVGSVVAGAGSAGGDAALSATAPPGASVAPSVSAVPVGTDGGVNEVNDTGTGASNEACPGRGSVTYHLSDPEQWPVDVVEKLTIAMEGATFYYNCYSNLTHDLDIHFNPGVPTAEGNVDGRITFGDDRGYMVVATAMHEVGHTMGVGYSPWSELLQDGRWIGVAAALVISSLPAEERDPDSYSQRDYLTGDSQHFWPYGLNQASEHQSEWSLINHVRIVAAMNVDKDTYRSTH